LSQFDFYSSSRPPRIIPCRIVYAWAPLFLTYKKTQKANIKKKFATLCLCDKNLPAEPTAPSFYKRFEELLFAALLRRHIEKNRHVVELVPHVCVEEQHIALAAALKKEFQLLSSIVASITFLSCASA